MSADPISARRELERVGRIVARAIGRGRRQGWMEGAAAAEDIDGDEPRTDDGGDTPMELARARLELSTTEIDVLWLLVGFDLEPRLRHALAAIGDDSRAVTVGTLLAVVYDGNRRCGVDELSSGGRLSQLGLLVVDPADADAPISKRRVRPAERVLELAMGELRPDRALDGLARIDETPASMLAELVANEAARTTLRAALGAAHEGILLVQGRVGSGRRSLLAAAIAASGGRALTIEGRAISNDRDLARTQLRTIHRECRLLGLTPLVRDLDALRGSGELPDRLDLLERELTGRTMATSSSRTARRWRTPPLVVELPDLTGMQRAGLWQRAIPSATAGDAEMLANLYPLAPALTASVGQAALRACGDGEMRPAHIEAAIRTVLDDRLAGLATRVTVTQTWDDLILPDDQTTAIIELLARVRERRRVFEEWGFAEKIGRGTGIAALFSGPPGTGKTMAAGLIARALHVELYQVDLSKIVSKWIGETEKNLASLFDAAEAGHAVLLFDEADALFGKRTEVRSSNDRHANQEVNYLLQRLESFAGICLLTTNHETAIDEAFRRRLAIQVRFPLPDAAERKKLWAALIPRTAPVTASLDFEMLAEKYVMSGGYIRNAVLRAAFLAADEQVAISGEHLARAAQLEYEAMGKVSSA